MDIEQSKELLTALKLILIGIFFWVLKVRYFTFFWLSSNHVLNIFGFEIIGTILIMMGTFIIHWDYPFIYSNIAILLNCIILFINIFNIFNFFIFHSTFFNELKLYTPFIMSLMLNIIAKLMQSSLRYLGNVDLATKWKNIGIAIFYGFSIPFYSYTTLHISGIISFEKFQFQSKIVLLVIPLVFTILFLLFYYLETIVSSFRYLLTIQDEKQ